MTPTDDDIESYKIMAKAHYPKTNLTHPENMLKNRSNPYMRTETEPFETDLSYWQKKGLEMVDE